ncbi:HAMP domain-containing sensor histidine kinase [Clostridium oceanicum]|uniref:histidine kinase n=1 Tax=Clostridium oceanicum TaxID=1543 RepID=A0ABN1JDG7_9CLOT
MVKLIIVLLLILLIIISTLYFLLSNEIKSISNQLHDINNRDTNSKILLGSSKKRLLNLVLEIDSILEKNKKNEIDYKRMDLQLRQSIANISHDLRTPLTSIMGYIQLMEDKNLSIQEREQYIRIIRNRTESLKMLITSFYDLSRLEAREYKFDIEPLDFKNIMSESIVSFYNDFINKGIEPFIDIDEKVSLISSDEKATKRIISNLIHNILKYGKSFVAISLKNTEDYVVTTFTNDAPNLNDENVKCLFKRFFMVDRARTGESTGIGLAITKRLIEQMGHTISAELSEGNLSIIIKWKIHKNLK